MEATGRPVGFRSVEIYRIEGERIAEEWVAPRHAQPHGADRTRACRTMTPEPSI
ncbi:hypothetical protein [Streptomyces gardneri]|uniref:hypothetical protein n=1 Tax=Streptomyces gardneri TaxID=66892 RepID=UPI0035D7C893